MKTIAANDIGMYISNALKNKNQNILFVSTNVLEYKCALKWFDEHPEYRAVRFTEPQAIYENKNGILVENKECFVIDDSKLKRLNDEKSILLCTAFSESCIDNFQGYLDILKWRFFINNFPSGECKKHSIEKMALFVAFTTPYNPNDYTALDEKYSELFDEVYLLD